MNFSPLFLKIQTLFFLTTITKQVHVTYTCINHVGLHRWLCLCGLHVGGNLLMSHFMSYCECCGQTSVFIYCTTTNPVTHPFHWRKTWMIMKQHLAYTWIYKS